ncbi:hypothetical protein [Cedecea sp.]|jgi:hypothetical protein|uniref:hypothetical protein n=1 Tax=Cedecea sp. TaxID=1970739 RepID=UPI0012AE4199|nr:hypothetical protein [Enterobacteriaceae bacterium RIT693]
MKLPRYLQVALLATAGAVVWSQLSDDEPASVVPQVMESAPLRPAKPKEAPPGAPRPARPNLFPQPLADTGAEQTEAEQHVEAEPVTPELPLQALGAWWSQHQRVILLTDGVETWPVCSKCKAEGKIWIGNEPVSGWQLKAVEKDHLLFEWRLTHTQRRLELGELQSEPTR